MKVNEAVKVALEHVQELFASEKISNLGLEEVDFDQDGEWIVTVGFSRPWDYPPQPNGLAALAASLNARPARSFKIVRIRDSDGAVIAIRNRATNS